MRNVVSLYSPDKALSTIASWLVVISGSLLFIYDFTIMNTFNSISTELLQDFKISATELGDLSAYYYYATIVSLFIAGILLDKIPTRFPLVFSMAIFVICTIFLSFAHSITLIKLCRFIMGISSTIGFLGCMRLVVQWFPQNRHAFVMGTIIALSMLGGTIAQTPMTQLTQLLGWRMLFLYMAAVGAILFAIMLCYVRDTPDGKQQKIQIRQLRTLIFAAVLNYKNWLLGLYASFMNLPLFIFGAMWGSIYLVQAHGLTQLQAASVSSMLFVGSMLGAVCIGWLSDALSTRKMPMLICGFATLAFVLIACYTHTLSFYTLAVLFFAIGLFTSGQVLVFPCIAENNSAAVTSSATSIASTLIMSGGVCQAIFGQLLDLRWQHLIINQVPQYSKEDYRRAIIIIPLALTLAIICICFINLKRQPTPELI